MNNAFSFVVAGGEETNGSLMGLMRSGSSVEGGPALAPASKAMEKEAAVKHTGRGGEEFVVALFWSCCFCFPVFQSLFLNPRLVGLSLCFWNKIASW